MRDVQKGLVEALVETFTTRGLAIVAGLLVTIVTTKYLSLDQRGAYVLAVTVSATACQLGNLGLHGANTYYAAKHPYMIPELVGNSLVVSLALGAVTATAIVWLAPFLGYDEYGPRLMHVVAISMAPAILLVLLQNLALGAHDLKTYNGSEMLFRYGALSLMFALVYFEQRKPELIFATSILSSVATVAFIWIRLSSKFLPIQTSWDLFKKSINFGYRAYLSSLLNFGITRFGLLYVAKKYAPEDLAIYSIAMVFFDLVSMIPQVVAGIFFPRVVSIENPKEQMRFAYLTALFVGLAVTVVSALVAILLPHVIPRLFEAQYLPAATIFWYLVPALVFTAINSIFMNYFAANGLPAVVIYAPAIGLAAHMMLMKYAFVGNGLTGVATSMSLAAILIFSMALIKSFEKRRD